MANLQNFMLSIRDDEINVILNILPNLFFIKNQLCQIFKILNYRKELMKLM